MWERTAECRPGPLVAKIIVFGFCVAVPLAIIGYVGGWFSVAAVVAKKEFGPSALLTKYEWFKDYSAALDAKRAQLASYDVLLADVSKSYGFDRFKWPRDVREDAALKASERIGLRNKYNAMCGEYNAQMAKFNWRFCNAGQLPQGATEPLPREYKPYDGQ